MLLCEMTLEYVVNRVSKHSQFIENPGYCHKFCVHRGYDNKQDPLYYQQHVLFSAV